MSDHETGSLDSLTEAQREQVTAFVERFAAFLAGEIGTCLHCQMPYTDLEKHGRCVYAYPCGHRQYQGEIPKKKPGT